ncbi:hypothetical protein EDB80DRAFT_883676 [Ilyonectria destructans]|nr:hypothetical protein EDB80DRAFT_883676 [Ilyonectria destructans]
MTVTWTILYPREAKFDFEYYIKTHVELAEKLFGPILVNWKVVKLGGEASPFQVKATFVFSSDDDYNTAMKGTIGAKLLEDIPRYTDAAPIAMRHIETVAKDGLN